MTTVACVFVRGHVPFTGDYVTKLASMVKRWMDRPYRFVCLTDRAYMFKGTSIETIAIEPWRGVYAWWNKLRLFDDSLGLKGRCLYLDLDTVVVKPLAPIIDYPARMALLPHAGKFEGKPPRHVVKRFNSSVMVWNGGERSSLLRGFDLSVTERLFGDQDWLGEQAFDGVETMPLEWFPRVSEIKDGPIPPEAKVILMKTPKNDKAVKKYQWAREAWC